MCPQFGSVFIRYWFHCVCRYRGLGMTVDEIVEVAMKLHSLKSLGFNLKIEDLFDEEGFSLSEVNQALRRPRQERVKVLIYHTVYSIQYMYIHFSRYPYVLLCSISLM